MSSKSWEKEMDKMLAGFERQARESLAKMKMSAHHDGLKFNSEFEKYFLVASNNRIEETYKRFKLNLDMETESAELNPIIQVDDSTCDKGGAGSNDSSSRGQQASGDKRTVNQRALFYASQMNSNRNQRAESSESDDEVPAKTPKSNDTEERRSSRRKTESSPPSGSRLSSTRRSRANEDLLLDNVTIHKLLDDVCKNENSWPFLRPVSRHEVPDYHKVIKQPMDLAKIKSKLNTGQYTTNAEVMKDIQLIFFNCDLYNQNESEIYVAGATLESYIVTRCKELGLNFIPSEMANSLNDDSSSKRKRQKL